MSLRVNQTIIKINIDTRMNLSNVNKLELYFRKPNGKEGKLPTEIIDIPNGIALYDSEAINEINNFLDIPGIWTFWAKIYYPNGQSATGEPWEEDIKKEGYK